MQHAPTTTALTLRALTIAAFAAPAIAGPTAPPAGPVGPTGKTLTEVEPRIAINAVNTPGDADATPSTFKITQPGSYYLTGNITGESGKHGIEIAAPGVTLDLNGFCMNGVAGSLSGVLFNSGSCEVRNGTVRLWGAGGVAYQPALFHNRVVNVRAVNNTGVGIAVGSYSEVRNCIGSGNGTIGIAIYSIGRAEGCTAEGNGTDGFYTPNSGNTFVNCVAGSNTGNGFNVGSSNILTGCDAISNGENGFDCEGSVVRGCNAGNNTSYGFIIGTGTTATNNRSAGNAGGGFSAQASCVLEGNMAYGNGGGVAGRSGFAIDGAGCRVANNHATGNVTGFAVYAGPCVLAGNTALNNTATGFLVNGAYNALLTGNISAGNAAAFNIPAGNDSGAVITNPGVGFTTTNPAANYAN